MATYIIGDIQGCFSAFLTLLEKINFHPSSDYLWLAGDIVNRGPQSLEMLEWAFTHQQKIQMVLGNHDLHLIARFYGIRSGFKDDTLDNILEHQNASKWIDWLCRQPLAVYADSLKVLMVHAGLEKSWTIETTLKQSQLISAYLASSNIADKIHYLQNMYGNEPHAWQKNLRIDEQLRVTTNFLTRVRYVNSLGHFDPRFKGEPANAPKDIQPWYQVCHRIPEDVKVVFGHWSALKGHSGSSQFINLDTGCIWGGPLTAYCIESDTFYRV